MGPTSARLRVCPSGPESLGQLAGEVHWGEAGSVPAYRAQHGEASTPRTCTLLSADGTLFKVDAIRTDERKKCSPLFSTCTEEMSINQIYMKMREQNSFVPKQRIFCPPHVPRNVLSKKAFLSQPTSSQKVQIWREFTDILPFDCPQHTPRASCMERY